MSLEEWEQWDFRAEAKHGLSWAWVCCIHQTQIREAGLLLGSKQFPYSDFYFFNKYLSEFSSRKWKGIVVGDVKKENHEREDSTELPQLWCNWHEKLVHKEAHTASRLQVQYQHQYQYQYTGSVQIQHLSVPLWPLKHRLSTNSLKAALFSDSKQTTYITTIDSG